MVFNSIAFCRLPRPAGLALAGILGLQALLAPAAYADQPEMEDALTALTNALEYLEAAEANKDGHRLEAISLVHQAIAEVKAGMEAAD